VNPEEKGLLQTLLRRRLGWEPEVLGPYALADAVRQRLQALDITQVSAYLTRLEQDQEEWQELIELLVVPETWFFRDVQPFRCLKHFLKERGLPGPGSPLRLLSVPCSGGEEAYSLALTLLGAGLSPGQMEVVGVDISRRALARARAGIYGAHHQREHDPECNRLLERFCQRKGERLVVPETVRQRVRFLQGNLCERTFLASVKPFDVIFCRNLLIYFDAPARRVSLANLHRLLRDGGLLYVGHVEIGVAASGAFQRLGEPFPSAFLRNDPVQPERRSKRTGSRTRRAPQPPPPAPQPARRAPVSLAEARAAADAGQLSQAAQLCQAFLDTQPPSAEAHALLGVIYQAQGQSDQARQQFQKALYLDPAHTESLIHMSLLARQGGDERSAAHFMRRTQSRASREVDA
jgi:chemotaxis protein methyltransferase WspC